MVPVNKNKILLFIIFAGLVLFACGCSLKKSPPTIMSGYNMPPGTISLDDAYWWRCQFKNVWPDDAEVEGAIDLLLAHAVVQPILSKHIGGIPFWRFHRRANRDAAGHQFSLIFYSRPAIASAIFAEIDQSEVLKEAIEIKLIKKVIMGNPNDPQSKNIEDTSDRNWSPELQRNWPAFIMGVSSLWLGLIDDLMQEFPKDIDDPNELLEQYREVDEKISAIWRNEGQHAFLHHLNAVFGYETLLIKKELSF